MSHDSGFSDTHPESDCMLPEARGKITYNDTDLKLAFDPITEAESSEKRCTIAECSFTPASDMESIAKNKAKLPGIPKPFIKHMVGLSDGIPVSRGQMTSTHAESTENSFKPFEGKQDSIVIKPSFIGHSKPVVTTTGNSVQEKYVPNDPTQVEVVSIENTPQFVPLNIKFPHHSFSSTPTDFEMKSLSSPSFEHANAAIHISSSNQCASSAINYPNVGTPISDSQSKDATTSGIAKPQLGTPKTATLSANKRNLTRIEKAKMESLVSFKGLDFDELCKSAKRIKSKKCDNNIKVENESVKSTVFHETEDMVQTSFAHTPAADSQGPMSFYQYSAAETPTKAFTPIEIGGKFITFHSAQVEPETDKKCHKCATISVKEVTKIDALMERSKQAIADASLIETPPASP